MKRNGQMQKQTNEREMTEEEEMLATDGCVCKGEWCWVRYQEGLDPTKSAEEEKQQTGRCREITKQWTSSQLCRQLHSIESGQHLSTLRLRKPPPEKEARVTVSLNMPIFLDYSCSCCLEDQLRNGLSYKRCGICLS